jgi:pimeloyl-ACP methyl ester carboxylesterase
MKVLTEDVLAVLDSLHIKKAHFFGYSFGGRVGFGMARYAPERVSSLVIGGAHPYEDSFDPFRDIDGKDPEKFVKAFEEAIGEPISGDFKKLVLANDLIALTALAQSPACMEDALACMNMPSLLLAGTSDCLYPRIRKCVAALPNGRFEPLDGLNHVQAFLRADLVVPRIKEFLKAVDSGAAGR